MSGSARMTSMSLTDGDTPGGEDKNCEVDSERRKWWMVDARCTLTGQLLQILFGDNLALTKGYEK